MHFILSFGFLLLATGSLSVNAQDYYLTARTTNGEKAFNFDAYAKASPDQRTENGVNAASQAIVNFITSQYQIIRATSPDNPTLDQLALTTKAFVGVGGGNAETNYRRFSSDGLRAIDGLTNTLEQQTSDFRSKGSLDPSSVTLANEQLVAMNADVNELDPDNNELAYVLTSLVNVGAETVETIQVIVFNQQP